MLNEIIRTSHMLDGKTHASNMLNEITHTSDMLDGKTHISDMIDETTVSCLMKYLMQVTCLMK